MNLTKRIVGSFVRVAIVAIIVAGSIGGRNERFLLGQVSELDQRQMQRNRIRGLGGSDVGDGVLNCSDSTTGTGIYMGHVSGVEGTDAFDDVEVLLTCGNVVLETAVPGPDGGFVFMGLPDGDYVVKVRKPGYRGPPARPFRLEGGVITSPPPGEIDQEFVLAPLDPNVFRYHWEEDQSAAGYDYAAHVNRPHVVEFLSEPIDVLDDASAMRLEREYRIILVNSDTGTWTQEHAYRLLETMKSIPQHYWIEGKSRWTLTSEHVPNDIWITGGGVQDDREVLIADEAFTYASPRTAAIDGKRGQYFSRRLHHAAVRFITDNGRHESSSDKILRERYGVTTFLTDHTTYRELTAHTTGEDASRFQSFHAEEIVQIINMFEEMPAGMRSTPGLQYLVRRKDGYPHPLYPNAPAVAWTDAGYIEFMETAFKDGGAGPTHRLIIHEKAHFLWAHLFDQQLKADWIEIGGWFETPESPSGWWTTKQTEFVSAYAHLKNPNEDMAESIAYFVINPDKLRSRAIGKYEFIRDRIMQGNFYISRIREDLTFQVYNLFPDYVFPGKIRRVDIEVRGAPTEDKTVTIELELHALDETVEGAESAYMRIASSDDTFTDQYFHPVDGERTGTVLGATFTLSKHVKSGYWIPTGVSIQDPHGNERFESLNDFGWQMYINNPLEDTQAPRYVPNSASLTLTTSVEEGRTVQAIVARWGVDEDTGMGEGYPCLATLNDELDTTYRIEEFGFYDETSQTCSVSFLMPDYMPSSVYSLDFIRMRDKAKKYGYYEFYNDSPGDEPPKRIRLTTMNPDTEAPHLDLNTISVRAIPTNPEAPNGETVVTLTIHVKDDISGFSLGGFYLRDPQGIDHHYYIYPDRRSHLFPLGDPSEWKQHVFTVILPAGSAPGTWGVSEMTLRDRARNVRTYDFTEVIHFEVESD